MNKMFKEQVLPCINTFSLNDKDSHILDIIGIKTMLDICNIKIPNNESILSVKQLISRNIEKQI